MQEDEEATDATAAMNHRMADNSNSAGFISSSNGINSDAYGRVNIVA